MLKNFIFDWSGTLADDLKPVWTATSAIFTHFGLTPLTLDEFRREFRLPFMEFYTEHLPDADPDELERLYEQFFADLHEQVTLLPGAKEFLHWSRTEGRRAFLLSTIKPVHFERQARLLGVQDAFEHAAVGVPDKRDKIHWLLEHFDLNPAQTCFIGDMAHDIATAHMGGILPVAVLTGFDPPEKLLPAGPAIIAQDLNCLLRVLA